MKKLIKWIAIILGGLIGVVLIGSIILYTIGKKKLSRTYANIPVESINIPTDSVAIARGKHISIIWGCTKCHGEGLGGLIFTNDPIGGTVPLFGNIPAANLTSGKGGIGKSYTNVDWIRAIRHGVKPCNKPE
ncbi:MAG TPA: hypothetical protein VKH37_05775, partial [Ferruginibacter sp.]|nr:hypothetical protein [Ferruginibacter sp.]